MNLQLARVAPAAIVVTVGLSGAAAAAVKAEYRWTVTSNGHFGMVAFLNTETLRNNQTGEKQFDSFATGSGFGLRTMLNKRSQTNLCFDIGWGKGGSNAVYFAVQEAF